MRIARPFSIGAASAALLLALAATAAASEFGNLSYRSIGPAISGGRTTGIAGSDRDPLLYYAGGADGGVYKSTNGGASWIPVFDSQSAAAVGTIAIDPHNDDAVWVGTGETNPRNDVEGGDGIFRTLDGGKTWTHLGLQTTRAISSISIDPRDSRTVVVGALGRVFADSPDRGVYVTRDGGIHWRRTLYIGPSSGVSDLVRLPGHPSTLLAGVWQFRREPWMLTSGGPLGGIYRSDDNGATWRKLHGNGLPAGLTGRIGLTAVPGGRVYAEIQSQQGELWRSDDGGVHWKRMPHSQYLGARAFYFSRVFADPANPNRVIAVGLILSMSTDGGRSFHPIATNAGWDYHVAWWSRDGRRIGVGSDEGLVMSGDGAARFWQPYDLPFSQAYHVGLGTTVPSYRVCIGLQDNSSWCGWSAVYNSIGVLNRDWDTIGPGDGMWALLDPQDPQLVWSTSTNSDTGQVFLFNERTQQASEVSPYARINAEAPSILKYRFNWDTPIAFTTENPPRVLVGGNVVFASSDRGKHWNVVSPDLTRNVTAHQQASGGPIDLDISGAETSDTLLDIEVSKLAQGEWWAGADDGVVQLTRDAGAHWTEVTPKDVAPWGRIAVEASRFSAGTAYVAVDRHMLGDVEPHLFATDDYGATWRSINGDLPAERFVRTIREDLRDRNMLYAGSQRGVFVSYDRGAHWKPLRLNMPATAIYDLEIQPQTDDLVVASHGRGVWILDSLESVRTLAQLRASGASLVPPREAYAMWEWSPVNSFTGGLPDNDFVGENPAGPALLDYYLPNKLSSAPHVEIADSTGRVVRHLQGDDVTNVAGINRITWDLAEDGPTQWKGTYKENQGPKEGQQVVPGTFTVRLIASGRTSTQPLTVKPDPRDPDVAKYAARYRFLAQAYADIGQVNRWLNAIDAKLKTASPAQAGALRTFQHQLTFNPRNVEDLGAPQGLRDRLFDVLARASSSNDEPTAAQTEEMSEITALYEQLRPQAASLQLAQGASTVGEGQPATKTSNSSIMVHR